MKPLVIYHANCADGFGAAFAAWIKLGEEAEYLPMAYGDFAFTEADLIGREVYILDFSLPKDRMDKLFAIAKRVVWLDHHKTAFEMWCGKYERGMQYDECPSYEYEASGYDTRYIELDDNRSGALIAWEYFHSEKEVPMLIKHIDDYDRWQFKLEGTKEFNKALWSYAPWSFEQWEEFVNDPYGFDILYGEGSAILRAHETNVKAVVDGATRECILSVGPLLPHMYVGFAANCPPHLASDVGHQLAKQSGTYGLLWYIDKDNKCKCSLRSNGDYDVSAIAKSFGGGGHKNAAGFEVPVETLLGWIK